jgi:prepilin-type processing-associated H-X9-DG protein
MKFKNSQDRGRIPAFQNAGLKDNVTEIQLKDICEEILADVCKVEDGWVKIVKKGNERNTSDMLLCPSIPGILAPGDGEGQVPQRVYGMFSYHYYLSDLNDAPKVGNFYISKGNWYVLVSGKMKQAAATPLLADSAVPSEKSTTPGYAYYLIANSNNAYSSGIPGLLSARHSNRSNIAFADGHVESIEPKAFRGGSVTLTSFCDTTNTRVVF